MRTVAVLYTGFVSCEHMGVHVGDQTGMGGGSTVPLDLYSSVLTEKVRAARLLKLRTVAAAASERLVNEARARWAASKKRSGWGDITALVTVFEN